MKIDRRILYKKPYSGWTPGEGLGKEGTGSLTPLLLELKFDKRGLEANEEVSVDESKPAIDFNSKDSRRC